MENADGDVVDAYRRSIGFLLAKAEEAKPGREIEPPLTETQLGESFWLLRGEDDQLSRQYSLQTRFAAVEIAFRERYYNLLVRETSGRLQLFANYLLASGYYFHR
jgi:THO complex subunit 1